MDLGHVQLGDNNSQNVVSFLRAIVVATFILRNVRYQQVTFLIE